MISTDQYRFSWVLLILLIPLVTMLSGYCAQHALVRYLRRRDSVDALLVDLCRLHRIEKGHRMLLNRLAELAAVEDPVLLITIPDQFEAAVETASRRGALTPRDRRGIGLLRRQLFGNLTSSHNT